jgi:hypothetical protein
MKTHTIHLHPLVEEIFNRAWEKMDSDGEFTPFNIVVNTFLTLGCANYLELSLEERKELISQIENSSEENKDERAEDNYN